MAITKLKSNPLKPIALPLGLRAAAAAFFAVYILLDFAAEIMSGVTFITINAFMVALLMIALAILDGIFAFRTGLRLPSRSIEVHGIGDTYKENEIDKLILSINNPNEKFLSWIGKWMVRASERFSQIPPPYQRLFEVALTAIAYGVIAAVISVLLAAFGHAGGRPDLSANLVSWLHIGIVVLTYGFWAAMLRNVYTAASWARQLSVQRIVNIIGSILIFIASLSFATQILKLELPVAPSFQPLSLTVFIGSFFIVAAISALAWLRSGVHGSEMTCTRIQLSDSAGVHPQSLVNALRSILQMTRDGVYSEIGDWVLNIEEQEGMPGGTFNGLLVGEYGTVHQQIGSSWSIRFFATVLGFIGISVGAAAYIMLWQSIQAPSANLWGTFSALWLFGNLALLIANIPLSETLWESHIMAFRIKGTYQGRSALMVAANRKDLEHGSFMIDYSLDGGIARARSVSFLSASMVKADAKRVLVNTVSDEIEAKFALSMLKNHLARAAGVRSKSLVQQKFLSKHS